MKFLHTGDLHIGKSLNEFSLLEDQAFFLDQIIEITMQQKVDAVVLAGDIYDRSIPSTEAVSLLDRFLVNLAEKNIKVLMISGNHDSSERVSFAGDILDKQGIYIAGSIEEQPKTVTLKDTFGTIDFVLLPFVRPANVGTTNSREAVFKLLSNASTQSERKVLVTHFFVTDQDRLPELSDSETTVHVGGLDHVEASLFTGYDYTALGHIHKPQQIGDRPVYYAGTPMKYSFSEVHQTKSVQIVTFNEPGNLSVEKMEIPLLHDFRKIKGKLEELIAPETVSLADPQGYLQVTLTDEDELIDPMGTLRSVYPNVCQILFEKNDLSEREIEFEAKVRNASIPELFAEFYEYVRGSELPEDRKDLIRILEKEAQEGGKGL